MSPVWSNGPNCLHREKMISPRAIAMAACIAAAYTVSAHGQSQPLPAPTCAEMLTAPTRDSVSLVAMLRVHAADRDLPETLQLTFGEALLKHLALPNPLGVDVYETSGDSASSRTAHLTLRGSYAAVLTGDGRVIHASTTGGARNMGFDVAMPAAMQAIDSTDLPSLAGARPKDIPIRLEITARDSTNRNGASMLTPVMVTAFTKTTQHPLLAPRVPRAPVLSFPPDPADSEPGLPLFRFRVPLRQVTSGMTQIQGVGSFQYPSNRLQAGTLAMVRASFVVDADGRAEAAGTQIINATQREFARTVLDALLQFRYRPLRVIGCAVRALAEEPFEFYSAR
jgi:hypothetical protein